MTSLLATRAVGIVAAESLTKIRVQTIQGRSPRDAKKCRATTVLGQPGDTKHSKCLLLGGRRLNQLTLIPKPKGSGGARAATAQVGPANKRNDTKRCLPFEASLRPEEAVPWSTTECPAVPNTSVQSCCQTSSARGDVTHCFYSHCDVIDVWTLAFPALKGKKASDWLQPTQQPK